MSFQVKEPVLIIGLGGAGSELALKAKDVINSECFLISNNSKDLVSDSIHVSTDSIINPTTQLIRCSAFNVASQIESKIADYSTIILMSNLAGKAGSAMAPVVSQVCKESGKGLISFAIMPFKYEKDRIFNSGVALKRLRENSECTIVLDNDSLLESNPDLSPNACYDIANSAIMHVVKSLGTSEISDTSIITTSRNSQNIEDSLRDSLKMLYDNAPPNTVKRSILYVVGGDDIPVGVLNSITSITKGILNEGDSQIDVSSNADESKIVMLSSVQGMTKFEKYDPLGMIPQENTLDWSMPDCSIDCNLELYQME